MPKPFLAFALGDPGGVGPWVSAAAAQSAPVRALARPLLVGDAWVVHHHLSRARFRVHPITDLSEYLARPATLNVLHVPHPAIRSLCLGQPSRVGGESAAAGLVTAVSLALKRQVAAVVTGPVSKESFAKAGVPFPGHTEFLAALSGARQVEMVMAAGKLLTLLCTRHLALRDVPRHLTAPSLSASILLVDHWLKKCRLFRVAPRWVLCGLNPHAGDNGLLGLEEKKILTPMAQALRGKGVKLEGPLPADVAWGQHASGKCDIVASLYHDQGMIPLKAMHPRRVVNITVGLPFVRTSPGHGTAYDLARGRSPYASADPTATIEAALWALRLARNGRWIG